MPSSWSMSSFLKLSFLFFVCRSPSLESRPGNPLSGEQCCAITGTQWFLAVRGTGGGTLPTADNLDMPTGAGDAAHLAVLLPRASRRRMTRRRMCCCRTPKAMRLSTCIAGCVSFGRGMDRRRNRCLEAAETQHAALVERGKRFDDELRSALERAGGKRIFRPCHSRLSPNSRRPCRW